MRDAFTFAGARTSTTLPSLPVNRVTPMARFNAPPVA